MSKVVSIVDYGVGNLLSVTRAVEKCGFSARLVSRPEDLPEAEMLILPGVGAFGKAMEELKRRQLDDAIRTYARGGHPLMGICLGMQLLFSESEEFGLHAGLGIIPGKVKAIPTANAAGERVKTPHIGWNALKISRSGREWAGTILEKIPVGSFVYYVHSFTAFPASEMDRLADSAYGDGVISGVVQRDNVWGLQFHPEKSGPTGLAIFESFLTRSRRT